MRTLRIIGVCIVVSIGGAVAWWNIRYPTYTYRYRMTVEVLVDGAVRSGSSVIEVSVRRQPKFGSAPPQTSHVHGEAVFVDLGGGRNVVALLAAGPEAKNVDYPYNVVPAVYGLTFNDQDLAKLSSLRGQRPVHLFPTFVTFADLNDSKSARVVPHYEFDQVFGPGVRIERAFVEVVPAGVWPFRSLGWPSALAGEPVTRGIEQKLPWWRGLFPWLKPIGGGTYVDTRQEAFKWNKGHFKRDF